jgi:hypothetical protein
MVDYMKNQEHTYNDEVDDTLNMYEDNQIKLTRGYSEKVKDNDESSEEIGSALSIPKKRS